MILDEAYVEFNVLQDPDESLPLLERHPNLVLLRTFSQGLRPVRAARGLRAVRLRGASASAVDQVRQPFFCNAAAQAAALEALNHTDEVTRRVERNLAERIGLEDGLRELGLEPAAVAGQLRLVRPGRGPRRRPTSCAGWPSAASSCAPAARSGATGRCASPSARRPRTSASWKRSAALL